MTFNLNSKRTWRGKRWFWNLKAANHEIICSGDSSGYHNRADAFHAIELVRSTGPLTVTRENGKRIG